VCVCPVGKYIANEDSMCVCGKGTGERGGKRPVKLLLVCNETLNNAKYPTKKKSKIRSVKIKT
jgi:hypothetical protein